MRTNVMVKRAFLCGEQAAAWALVLLLAGGAAAHGVGYREIMQPRAVTLAFHYSSGEPMAYCEVLVFAPGDDEVEYQNGRTARDGRFSFCPETSGVWRVEVSDGRGHKAVAEKTWQATPEGAPPSGEAAPAAAAEAAHSSTPGGVTSVVLGISLIFNFFLVLHWLRNSLRRQKT